MKKENVYLIQDYEDEYGHRDQSNFAEACYNDNTIEELSNPSETDAQNDCDAWNIDIDEWRDARLAAKNEMGGEILQLV